jgi:hypothetical protein
MIVIVLLYIHFMLNGELVGSDESVSMRSFDKHPFSVIFTY